jgi:hypothetical protein
MRSEAAAHPESRHFSELASRALRRALTETVGQHGASLFGLSVDDLRAALRQYSGSQRFGRVARLFFGDRFARTPRSYVEPELSIRTGAAPALHSIDGSQELTTSLERYARESARIMESFAAGWYSEHN